ncbi:hypothetical protein NDU88_005550 [Pleurodeles waltl]|uniref:Uncharacterized protein n=1 Tax=Pleurodeles waltl TaxID=8319 RepID=A0AAV7NWY4_PLEWA|nr:hypothetical protein NDU88_005550 [Pleurodeles waltl]
MPSSTGSGGGFVPCDADPGWCKVTVSHLGDTPTGVAGARTHHSPWRHDYILLTGGDGCSVDGSCVASGDAVSGGGSLQPFPCSLGQLPTGATAAGSGAAGSGGGGAAGGASGSAVSGGGGFSPSPAASDGFSLELLLLAVVLLAMQVAVLLAVQVAMLLALGEGSSPSPAASDG